MDGSPLTPDEIEALRRWLTHRVTVESRRHASEILDGTRSWVDPRGYRLSDRLWNTRESARRAIDDRIREALLRGEDALDVADQLERWLHPGLQPTRNASGFVVADARPGLPGSPVLTWSPRGQYPGSYSTRRLMRTEITRVAGQETDEIARDLDLYVEWLLSPRHPETDNCDNNASGSSRGMPQGVYTVDECPSYPDHPHCLCTKTTYDPRTDDEILADLRGTYRLNHWVDPATGEWHIDESVLDG